MYFKTVIETNVLLLRSIIDSTIALTCNFNVAINASLRVRSIFSSLLLRGLGIVLSSESMALLLLSEIYALEVISNNNKFEVLNRDF